MFNNGKITYSYTEEMHAYQPEDLNLILEKFSAEFRKNFLQNFGKLTELIMNHV